MARILAFGRCLRVSLARGKGDVAAAEQRREDASFPISDQTITGKLSVHGIDVSRRTIAKYRDEMGIPSSSARRRY
ncbi:MAG: hypothetical protein LBS67_02545 [Clostridiales Family XIII bacterium]|nr:hypothetical protein [Clostridiales Family XIII bacterium]